MSTLTIDEIKEKIYPIAKEYNVPRIYLFGSYARGEENENSDIDLVFEPKGSKATGILKKFDFKDELERALNKEVDLIRTDEFEDPLPYLERMTNYYFNERILIYEDKETSRKRPITH